MPSHYLRAPQNGWTGKLLWGLLRMAFNVCIALFQVVVGRLRRRPLHPAWSVQVEVIVRTLRISVAEGLQSLEVARLAPLGALPPGLRKRVQHGHGTLAGREYESFTPHDWQEQGKTCLYLHGGGYVTCSPATHRMLVAQIAVETGLRCISLDYRLAPENPFPAALEDADAAFDALLATGVRPSRLWIGGDSAGGGLSLATMLRRRDRGAVLPAGAILLSPWVDLSGRGASVQSNEPYDYLPAKLLHTFAGYYYGDQDPDLPEISPIQADLTGLSPLLMLTGDAELLLSENIELASRAREAGVHIEHVVAESMVHVYPAVLPFVADSKRAFAHMNSFVDGIGDV